MINYKSIIENLDPHKKIFNEFIFRDKYNKLYKLDSNNKKIYFTENINYDDYLFKTCENLDSENKYLNTCSSIFFDLVKNYDSTSIKNIIAKINKINKLDEFLFVTKENIKKLDYNSVMILLNKLKFKKELKYDLIIEKDIFKIQNTIDWIQTKDEGLREILYKNPLFIKYLQLLVDYINSNPSILNEKWTSIESNIYKIKELEIFLKTNYDEINIYKNILEDNKHDKNNILSEILSDNTNFKFYDQIDYYFTEFQKKYSSYLKNLDLLNVEDKNDNNPYWNFVEHLSWFKDFEIKFINKLKPILKFLVLNPSILNYTNKEIRTNYADLDKEVIEFVKLKNKLKILYEDFEKKYN